MQLVIIVLVLVFLFGGGGYYTWGHPSYGPLWGGGISLIGVVVAILIVLAMSGRL